MKTFNLIRIFSAISTNYPLLMASCIIILLPFISLYEHEMAEILEPTSGGILFEMF